MTHLPLLTWERKEALLEAADHLEAAADLLNEADWAQNDYRRYLGTDDSGTVRYCYCAAGAIRQVSGFSWGGANSGVAPAIIAESLFYRVTGEWLPNFNDAPGRTKTQVQAKLREVAHMTRLKIGKEETHAPQP